MAKLHVTPQPKSARAFVAPAAGAPCGIHCDAPVEVSAHNALSKSPGKGKPRDVLSTGAAGTEEDVKPLVAQPIGITPHPGPNASEGSVTKPTLRVMPQIRPHGRGNPEAGPFMNTIRMNERSDAWSMLPWEQFRADVFRLQERIAQAATIGDRQTTHRLQRLLVTSFGAKCLAVRQVAQLNRGRNTAGVDKLKSLTNAQCLTLANMLDLAPTRIPVRRVWIPKPGKDELRPLGIPTMRDRAQQALVKLALEPEWEPRFEHDSYGFRPKRSCADAMIAIFNAINKRPKFVLDADVKKCFDQINQGALLRKIQAIRPIHRLIRAWLKAGVLDGRNKIKTNAGTPQGGVISPLLANIALHGLETHVKAAVQHQNPPIVIRYADDFVVIHADHAVIELCRNAVIVFLKTVGLELSPTKTTIRHTQEIINGHAKPGFNFLGYNFRCVTVSPRQKKKGWMPLVTPSQESVKRHYHDLREIIDQCCALDQSTLIARLNPVIRGWANYYRCCNASAVFSKVDHLLFRKLWRWCHRRHPRKGKRWIVTKYWNGGRPWTFEDRATGKTLEWHRDIHMRRHTKVRGAAHVFDRNRDYWATRQPHRRQTKSMSAGQDATPPAQDTTVDLWR